MSGAQLPLPLGLAPAGDPPFLLSATNEAAARAVLAWPDWPENALYLFGPAGSGKSLLARTWARRAGAAVMRAADLTEQAALSGEAAFAIDDLEELVHPAALFHLVNAARTASRPLLLVARAPAARLGIGLKDLETRLIAMPARELSGPDEALLERLLVRGLESRQIAVDVGVIAFLLDRMERSGHAAVRLVAALDEASLALRRPVGLDLARKVLESFTVPSAKNPG